jgi:GTPase SAR1 family protein
MKSYYQLIPEKKYMIKRIKNKQIEILEGTFVSGVTITPPVGLMINMKNRIYSSSYFGFCYDNDIFYDIEEIRENARKARESMEHRSVNLILKRLINEEFEW